MATTKDEKINDIPKIQEFKRRLAALLTEYGAEISSTCDGDTHGIYDERVIFYLGDQHFTILTDIDTITPLTLVDSIGTEVVTAIPVKPAPVIATDIFPVGTRVRLTQRYIGTCHSGRHELYQTLRGVVVPMRKEPQYSQVLWNGYREPQGYPVNALEKLPEDE